jgi:glycosyltransferase involved in cell wall biosynthesis
MPMLNAGRYVAEAIDSILNQTYEDFELLVANDGSTDGCEEIVRDFEKHDARVKLLHRTENRGIVYTRNELLEHTTGEFTAMMDADDICMPERFEKQVEWLDAHPDYVAVGSRVLLIDPEGNPMCTLPIRETHEEIDKWHIEVASGTAMANPTVTMRTQAVRDVGGYDEDAIWAEDYDLFLRLGEHGKLATMPDVFLHYRQHFTGTGYARNYKQRKAIHVSVEKACKRRGLPVPKKVSNEKFPNRNAAYAYWQWAEWSMRGGNMATARKYLRMSLLREPWTLRTWRTAAKMLLRAVR